MKPYPAIALLLLTLGCDRLRPVKAYQQRATAACEKQHARVCWKSNLPLDGKFKKECGSWLDVETAKSWMSAEQVEWPELTYWVEHKGNTPEQCKSPVAEGCNTNGVNQVCQ